MAEIHSLQTAACNSRNLLAHDLLELVGAKFENPYRINWDGSVMGCSFDTVLSTTEGRSTIRDVPMHLSVEALRQDDRLILEHAAITIASRVQVPIPSRAQPVELTAHEIRTVLEVMLDLSLGALMTSLL